MSRNKREARNLREGLQDIENDRVAADDVVIGD